MKRVIKSYWNDYNACLVSPLLVLSILALFAFVYKLYPLGANSLAWCDMNQQVIPLLLEFKDILRQKANFFLNMQNAGGMNFWGVFLFFLASPFSLLVAFVEKQDMFLFVNLFVGAKMACCAITASLFFKKQFSQIHWWLTSLLGVMYAFCGYTMLFYQNLVWLDVMYLFPVLLLSVEMLCEQKNVTFYIIALSCMVAVNFYLSYMVVLFLLFFFGTYIFLRCPVENLKEIASRFLQGSIVAAFITGVIWLPALAQYNHSARSGSLFDSLTTGRFFADIYTTLPILFCSAIIFACLPFLFSPRQARSAKVKSYIVLFLLMLVPVVIEPINKMWHTGSYQAFPVRYGYITIFMGLILVAEVLESRTFSLKAAPKLSLVLISAFALLVFYALWIFMLRVNLDKLSIYTRTLWGNQTSFVHQLVIFVVAAMCYFLFLYIYRKQLLSKSILLVFFSILTIGECFYCAGIYIGSVSRPVEAYKNVMALEGQIFDRDFYRVKLSEKYFDVNLVGGMGYNTLNHYTSLTAKDYLWGMKKLGYSSNWMEVNSAGGTLFTDALLCNKYRVMRTFDLAFTDHAVYSNPNYSLVKNEFYLPLGIKTKTDITKSSDLENKDRLEVQNEVFSSLFANGTELFSEIPALHINNVALSEENDIYRINRTDGEGPHNIKYSLDVGEKTTLYFDCFNEVTTNLVEPINDSFSISVNGLKIADKYPSQRENGILELGTFENESVVISVEVLKDTQCRSFGVYAMPHRLLRNAIASAPAVAVNVNGQKISCQCEALEGEFLHLALPYDKGYRAKINGKKVPIRRVNETFMALKLTEGKNNVQLKYSPPGFQLGLALSLIGVALFWLIKKATLKIAFVDYVCSRVFYVLLISAAGVVYVAPVVVFWVGRVFHL